MKHLCLAGALITAFGLPSAGFADEPVFSGPQAGEKLPPLPVTSVLGSTAGEEVDLVAKAGGKPVLLVFAHSRTRPGFALTNLLMRYAAQRADDGLHSAVIFLTDDATSTQQWVRVVQQHFRPETTTYGISKEGQEGPGAYGLNRNVELTILVGAEGKVTGNFALVQPSVEADGPKILEAIVNVTGGGEVPTVAQLGGDGYGNREMAMRRPGQQGENDPALRELLRSVIQRDAKPEDVKTAVEKVEKYVEKNKAARNQLGQIASTIVKAGRVETYGTGPAQEALRKWAKAYGPVDGEKADEGK